MTAEERLFKIFYAWQSDLPEDTNRRFIRNIMRSAANALEERYEAECIRIEVDEATRGTSGSPNIPATILRKIRDADMFLGDLSIIRPKTADHDALPNPNVLFELGYAVSELGWERIVMLGNAAFEDFPEDLPFDIDRQRASPYSRTTNASTEEDRAARNRLKALLIDAVSAVLDENPLRPAQRRDLSPQERKRQHDVGTLKEVLCCVHIPTLEDMFKRAPHVLAHPMFHFWEQFHARLTATDYHVYDQHLRDLLDEVHGHWHELVSHGSHYRPTGGDQYVFGTPMGGFPPPDEDDVRKRLRTSVTDLEGAWRGLMKYVREEYLAVDPTECSQEAARARRQWLADRDWLDS